MKIAAVDKTLNRLAGLIGQGRFEELETDTLEIKAVPADSTGWREPHKSACAFLNTRGGILIFGVKEEGAGTSRKYVFTGWQPHAEPNLKEFSKQFTKRDGTSADLHDAFPPPMILDFMGGKVAVMLVDELPADRKFVFYRGTAYRRVVTGDHSISEHDIDKREEYREEARQARELEPVEGVGLVDLDLDKLNDYITQLNRPVKVETVKPDLESALPFLVRKSFIRDGTATTLGVLVCGKHPADRLGFRCQVHGYVDAPQEIARDKQDFSDNVLPLMEGGLAYLIKSEWANEKVRYTILLTPDNNHFTELVALEQQGLINKHPSSTAIYPIYVADRVLVRKNYLPELRRQFGLRFDGLDLLHKDVLSVVYRHNHYSRKRLVSAKAASYSLWYERGESPGDIKEFDAFYRKVRRVFNRLRADGLVEMPEGTRGYLLKSDGGADALRPTEGTEATQS